MDTDCDDALLDTPPRHSLWTPHHGDSFASEKRQNPITNEGTKHKPDDNERKLFQNKDTKLTTKSLQR
ncbi:hypothetical protein TcWFU_008004 [Taenia crassiceps]|uniref:Uncharacterized protein n=1 Tax=Taenia crassiceps TaxID=6207 RepID=A0ABR4QSV4_9CEST